ncbi:hypothetical protein MMC20_000047 [Loxospora ochrophaea]|nr:hypothetical protein [Loxospora ochrophaea]
MGAPPSWSLTPISGLSLDAAGLVALADLDTIGERSALTSTASYLDIFVLCPGIHRQQSAIELNGGELPPTAALTSGYVFRVENQATVNYLQKVSKTGHLTTLAVEEISKTGVSWRRTLNSLCSPSGGIRAMVPYLTAVVLTVIALVFMILIQDWWGLGVLLILMLARLLNVVVTRDRSVEGWKGAKEPDESDLLILLSQDRWVRLKGTVNAVKAVTSGQWLKDKTFWHSSLVAIATLLVYLDAAVVTNASQAGQIILLALLLISVGLLAVCNEFTEALQMYNYTIKVYGQPKKYKRRLDLAKELIKETKSDEWAVGLGLINANDRATRVTL